jgi:hypothetical protein
MFEARLIQGGLLKKVSQITSHCRPSGHGNAPQAFQNTLLYGLN